MTSLKCVLLVTGPCFGDLQIQSASKRCILDGACAGRNAVSVVGACGISGIFRLIQNVIRLAGIILRRQGCKLCAVVLICTMIGIIIRSKFYQIISDLDLHSAPLKRIVYAILTTASGKICKFYRSTSCGHFLGISKPTGCTCGSRVVLCGHKGFCPLPSSIVASASISTFLHLQGIDRIILFQAAVLRPFLGHLQGCLVLVGESLHGNGSAIGRSAGFLGNRVFTSVVCIGCHFLDLILPLGSVWSILIQPGQGQCPGIGSIIITCIEGSCHRAGYISTGSPAVLNLSTSIYIIEFCRNATARAGAYPLIQCLFTNGIIAIFTLVIGIAVQAQSNGTIVLGPVIVIRPVLGNGQADGIRLLVGVLRSYFCITIGCFTGR